MSLLPKAPVRGRPRSSTWMGSAFERPCSRWASGSRTADTWCRYPISTIAPAPMSRWNLRRSLGRATFARGSPICCNQLTIAAPRDLTLCSGDLSRPNRVGGKFPWRQSGDQLRNEPHSLTGRMKGRIYVAAADQDGYHPPEMAGRLENALRDAGVDHRCEIYSDALHG
jgi:hypothetical protein